MFREVQQDLLSTEQIIESYMEVIDKGFKKYLCLEQLIEKIDNKNITSLSIELCKISFKYIEESLKEYETKLDLDDSPLLLPHLQTA